MGRISFLVTVLCLVAITIFSDDSYACTSGFKDGKLSLNCKLPKRGEVQVNIQLRNVRELYPLLNGEWKAWGGHESPNVGVQSMSIRNNKEDILVPFSVYANLFNLNEVRVDESEGKIIVHFIGGSEGTRYRVLVTIARTYVWKKRISSAEMPELFYEEVTYGYAEDI